MVQDRHPASILSTRSCHLRLNHAPESACRWPQVFHTQGIRLRPMTLFNPVFNCLTPIVIKRSKTQAEGGTDSSRRSWLCRSASAPSQQACEPVQDRCSGPCSRHRHAAAWRSRKRAPAGWVAVEATSRPRQFGYETPQLRLEGIVPNYPIGRLTVRAALRGPQCLLTRSVSEGLFPFCRKDLRQSSLTLRVSVERNRRCQGRDAVNPRPWDDPGWSEDFMLEVPTGATI